MFFGIGMGLGLVSGKCMCVWVLWVVNESNFLSNNKMMLMLCI